MREPGFVVLDMEYTYERNALNGTPSIFPRTLTSPRDPKNSTDAGQMTKVQPPLFELFWSLALKRLFNIQNTPFVILRAYA